VKYAVVACALLFAQEAGVRMVRVLNVHDAGQDVSWAHYAAIVGCWIASAVLAFLAVTA
jgi:hypothetical protein